MLMSMSLFRPARQTGPALARRKRRGVSLLEASLTTLLLVMVVSGALEFWSTYIFRQGLQAEAAEVAAVARAAKTYVLHDFDARLKAVRANPKHAIEVPLTTAGFTQFYSPLAPKYTTRRRPMKVYLWSPSATSIIVVAHASFGSGSAKRTAAPRGSALVTAVGWIPPHKTKEVHGPGIRFNITALKKAFSKITSGDLIALEYVSRARAVLPYLHRSVVTGQPELNAMQTDLDMTGHKIIGISDLRADTVHAATSVRTDKLTGVVTVNGPVKAVDLTITKALTIDGTLTALGNIAATTATIDQAINAGSLNAATATLGVVTAGQVNAKTITSKGQIQTKTYAGDSISVKTVATEFLETNALVVEKTLTANAVVAKTVETQGCTGC